jgi:hypothetical protein
MERYRASLRTVPTYKAWFDFAEELNRLGLDMLGDRDVPRDDNQLLTIAILFVRAVLGGFELSTDVHVVRYPHRYMDKRGQEMWDRVFDLVLSAGTNLKARRA